MKRLLFILFIFGLGVPLLAQTSDPPTMEETPDTIPNLGSRKAVRQLVNWNALRNRLDREDIDTLQFTVGDSATVTWQFIATDTATCTTGLMYRDSDDDSLWYCLDGAWINVLAGTGGGGGGTLTEEQVEDYVGGMVTGNTETGISVTYEDGDGTLDFVIGDLSGTYETQLDNEAGLYSALSDVTQFLEPGDAATLLDGTADRLLWVNGSGDVAELALGTDNQVLKMDGSSMNWEEDASGASADSSFATVQADSIETFDGDSAVAVADLYNVVEDTVDADSIFHIKTKTTELWTWSFGDSASMVIDKGQGGFYHFGPDTIQIDSVMSITYQGASACDFDYQIEFATDISGADTDVFSSEITVTGADSYSTGQWNTPTGTAKIPPGNHVWMYFSEGTTKPDYGVSITVVGKYIKGP